LSKSEFHEGELGPLSKRQHRYNELLAADKEEGALREPMYRYFPA
jgi:hypothetical protein